jgi:phosphoserine phosphatase
MKIYLIRHGETEFNRLGIVQGSSINSDLNRKGERQGKDFYRMYKDVDFQLIITSSLKRTHQTVQDFIHKGIPWIQNDDIIEINWGEQEGKVSTPESRKAYKKVVDEWTAGNYDVNFGSGESATELGNRVNRFLDWLRAQDYDQVLICSHGRAMRAIVCLMQNKPLHEMENTPHSNTGLYLINCENGVFSVEKANDLSHLHNEQLIMNN